MTQPTIEPQQRVSHSCLWTTPSGYCCKKWCFLSIICMYFQQPASLHSEIIGDHPALVHVSVSLYNHVAWNLDQNAIKAALGGLQFLGTSSSKRHNNNISMFLLFIFLTVVKNVELRYSTDESLLYRFRDLFLAILY